MVDRRENSDWDLDDSRGTCPACGRYTGPVRACPYCNARVRVEPWQQVVRGLSLLLATLGLLFLYLYARGLEVQPVTAASLRPTMNYARVRVEGVVTRRPYVRRESGDARYVSFLVDDGTGSVRVCAYRGEASQLEAMDCLPHKGAGVSAVGTLRIREDDARLVLDRARDVRVYSEDDTVRMPRDGGRYDGS